MLCTIAKVSPGGYYQWLAQADVPQKDHEYYLLIKKIFDQGKAKYGFRTIYMKLLEHGVVMNHKKILRIMRTYDLHTKIRRRNPYKMIMKKSLAHRTFANTLNRVFSGHTPYTVFCTDITYIPYHHRFAYLSVIKDIASGEIVAWHMARHLEMDLVLTTIEKLKNNGAILAPGTTIIHSDQGFHYTNPLYIRQIEALEMVQSMSRKGNCIDNAPIESFFGHMKDDVDYKGCTTFEELHGLIEAYMEYYNTGRPQWKLKKMTPVAYRNHLLLGV